MKTWTRILTSTATGTWVAAGLLTINVVFSPEYFLRKHEASFKSFAEIRIDRMRRELTAAKMPPDQVAAVADAMGEMRRDVASHVRSASFTLWGTIMIIWLLVLSVLFKAIPQQPNGPPE